MIAVDGLLCAEQYMRVMDTLMTPTHIIGLSTLPGHEPYGICDTVVGDVDAWASPWWVSVVRDGGLM